MFLIAKMADLFQARHPLNPLTGMAKLLKKFHLLLNIDII